MTNEYYRTKVNHLTIPCPKKLIPYIAPQYSPNIIFTINGNSRQGHACYEGG